MSNQIPFNMIRRDSHSHVESNASMPGELKLSDSKLRSLRPDMFSFGKLFKAFAEKLKGEIDDKRFLQSILLEGDSQPAIVISLNPLLVSAYTDEFDGVVILNIPQPLAATYQLQLGTRLLACCFYSDGPKMQRDIIVGPSCTNRWRGVHPELADFLSADYDQIRYIKSRISEDSWHKAWYMGLAYRQQRPGWVRVGLPLYSQLEAERPVSGSDLNKSVFDRV